MSSTRLGDDRGLHLPGAPLVLDARSVIVVPTERASTELAPLFPTDDLPLLTGRLVIGTMKKRRAPHHAELNRARLKLARLCVDRALTASREFEV
ncbi:hypothetical protein [Salipiger sp. PrR003]|uniref:hypothetical protein n=1 Tax=Salipiger sp. PrR003 TaxID=2706776 RepID=UPI0013DCE8B7|nr:hypothetical protein [Salipiger sp. PrR003]NDV53927.1 hypothetical protein [Salipiger sp. PrR003]